jgi:hypothetical protein
VRQSGAPLFAFGCLGLWFFLERNPVDPIGGDAVVRVSEAILHTVGLEEIGNNSSGNGTPLKPAEDFPTKVAAVIRAIDVYGEIPRSL